MNTARVFPHWWRTNVDVGQLTEDKLRAMRAEAAMCDENNTRAYNELRAAYDAYREAARAFGGRIETVRRNGCTYFPAPVAPGATVTRAVEDLARSFEEAQKRKAAEAARRKDEAEQATARRAADLELARLILRYEAPESADWDDMLDALCSRNKYLDLAVAGLETRGDWSEGFYRVSGALARFDVQTDQDKLIMADLLACMDNDDGRIFRDTTWSYDRLFGLVDPQLVADARLCLERRES